jgi:hypothetical protein
MLVAILASNPVWLGRPAGTGCGLSKTKKAAREGHPPSLYGE